MMPRRIATTATVHRLAIAARGMKLLDNLDLELAAETAARLKRWEFMLIVAPPRVPVRRSTRSRCSSRAQGRMR
jgi:hypothetical protein